MQLFATSYTDVLEHSSAVLGWQQTYDQLECGQPRSTLTQLYGDGYQIFLESIDKRVAQRGRSPDERLCIGVSWQGATFDRADWALASGVCQVALLRNAEPFNLHMPAGATLLSVNVDFARFRELGLTCLDDDQLRQIDDASSIEVPMPVVARVAGRLRGAMQQAAGQDGTTAFSCEDSELVDLVMSGSLELFGGGRHTRTERCRSLAVSTWLVRRSEELLFERAAVTLTVTDLCNHLKVSPRALQNSFHAVTGTAPLEYLRGLRLNAVRRRLAATSSDALSVGDAAAEMGFYHLSHFSRHYRDLFGELPSNTRRACGLSARQGIRQH